MGSQGLKNESKYNRVLVIWAPIPSILELKCSVWEITKEKLDKEKDEVIIDTRLGGCKRKMVCKWALEKLFPAVLLLKHHKLQIGRRNPKEQTLQV